MVFLEPECMTLSANGQIMGHAEIDTVYYRSSLEYGTDQMLSENLWSCLRIFCFHLCVNKMRLKKNINSKQPVHVFSYVK